MNLIQCNYSRKKKNSKLGLGPWGRLNLVYWSPLRFSTTSKHILRTVMFSSFLDPNQCLVLKSVCESSTFPQGLFPAPKPTFSWTLKSGPIYIPAAAAFFLAPQMTFLWKKQGVAPLHSRNDFSPQPSNPPKIMPFCSGMETILQTYKLYGVCLKVSSPFTVIYREVPDAEFGLPPGGAIQFRQDPTDKSFWGITKQCRWRTMDAR